MIIHDYVVARMGIDPEGNAALVPDGTYTGYKWDGRYWKKNRTAANTDHGTGRYFLSTQKEEGPKKICSRTQRKNRAGVQNHKRATQKA